jgi:hypothetical protein
MRCQIDRIRDHVLARPDVLDQIQAHCLGGSAASDPDLETPFVMLKVGSKTSAVRSVTVTSTSEAGAVGFPPLRHLSNELGVAILEPRPTIHKFNELGRFGLVLRVA